MLLSKFSNARAVNYIPAIRIDQFSHGVAYSCIPTKAPCGPVAKYLVRGPETVRPDQKTRHIWSRPVVSGPTLRMRWNVRTGEREVGELSKQRAVMPEEEDIIDKACVYLLEHRYPDGCSGNAKRIIRRKAETLAMRDGEVFYLKARKDSDGKKVFHEAILS